LQSALPPIKKLAVDIVRLVSPHEMADVLYLVPTEIGDPGPRGEPNIRWACVETKEAAEILRDVRKWRSPIFGMQVEETVAPDDGC
jgi:hypothetical protein